MKRFYILLFSLLLLTVGCVLAVHFLWKSGAPEFEMREIERSTADCEENCLSVNINYLYCKSPSSFAENFNKEMELQVSNFLLGNREDTLQVEGVSIESALESFMTDYNNIHEHFPDIPAYELMLNDSIMFKNSKMLTVFSDRYSFTGAANAFRTKVFTHFDLSNGEVITNENLFTDEAKVAQIAEKYFKREQENFATKTLDEKGFWFEDGVFHLPKNIGIGKDYLHLFYEPFEIAAYVDTAFEVKVPMNEVQHYLTFSDKK
ncbi:protein of unknown function [Capnocytophaga haemolytica]|uniref:Protein of uncharacterized function (DUF3298) n=1 Tax=Capnocytophaga haemolytica TaxID=45243 RepID=A0AAX2GWI9_9FLAO|nr:DUF3298 and DUF4163 domain-containing protein [Capnocytophaga haemolytica]AMD84857.1 hypothetical protein AXF12_04610 [Capnocytophaga haemolytica]SFN76458.1 protein of unknown function [Capnocytophaga haemolytica]SNV06820.1 Protein of uncharacterised function (DUF3298) [Capnocytophaga haemolytica]